MLVLVFTADPFMSVLVCSTIWGRSVLELVCDTFSASRSVVPGYEQHESFHTWNRSSMMYSRWMYSRSVRSSSLTLLWYNLHDLGHFSWLGSVLYSSCTTSHTGRLRSICRSSRSWYICRWSRSWSICRCLDHLLIHHLGYLVIDRDPSDQSDLWKVSTPPQVM